MANRIVKVDITHLKGVQGPVEVPNGATALSVAGIGGAIWLWLVAEAESVHTVTRLVTVVRDGGSLIANRGGFVGTVVLTAESASFAEPVVWHVFVG